MISPANIVLIGSATAIIGSLLAAFGVYLGSLQNQKDTEHLLASLTGGNSYPQVIISGIEFSIAIRGNYPLHEVHGEVVDISSLRELQASGNYPHKPVPYTQYFNIGTLSSAYGLHLINRTTGKPLNVNQFKKRKCYRFMVKFFTRHHTYNYRLALEPRENGGWHQAWQVYRDQEKEPMAETIPEDFPKNLNNEVDFLLMGEHDKIYTNK